MREAFNPQNPEGLTIQQATLAEGLFTHDMIQFGAFKLALHDRNPEAPLSPYYINLRLLPRYPYLMQDATEVYAELAKEAEAPEVCMGIPEAGNPLATAFSLATLTPQIYLRKEEKIGHGIPGNFMTPINPGEKVLLIDDVITAADSKINTIATLEESGLEVKDILVLVDREQGGAEELVRRGYNLHAAMKFSQLLDYYHRTGMLDNAKYKEAKDYLEANK